VYEQSGGGGDSQFVVYTTQPTVPIILCTVHSYARIGVVCKGGVTNSSKKIILI
jgi:hypothetical protein